MLPGIDEIKNLALKYSKKELANMAQLGLVDPQKAVMAGMMRDRISQEDVQLPFTTVAQDILGVKGQPQVVMPSQEVPQEYAEPDTIGIDALLQHQEPSAGVAALPSNIPEMAGGGIVAFADGGMPFGVQADLSTLIPEERARYLQLVSQTKNPNNPYEAFEQRILQNFSQNIGRPRSIQQKLGIPLVSSAIPSAGMGRSIPTGVNLPITPTAIKTTTLPGRQPISSNTYKIPAAERELYPKRELAEITAEREAAERAAGVNKELTANMLKRIDEKRGNLEGQKSEAAGHALMMAGLGLMGAKRGQEFSTLSDVGIKALNAYKADINNLQYAKEKYDERAEALLISDNQAKQTGARADIAQRDADRRAYIESKGKLADAQDSLNATAAQVGANIYHTNVQRDIAGMQIAAQRSIAGMQAETQRRYHASMKQQGLDDAKIKQIMDAASKFQTANALNYIGKPEQLMEDSMAYASKLYQSAQGALTGNVPIRSPAPAIPNVGAVVNGYKFIGGDPQKKSSWEKVK
jgi:hypothetical protein